MGQRLPPEKLELYNRIDEILRRTGILSACTGSRELETSTTDTCPWGLPDAS
jgi:hypothetical protein